MGSERGEGLVVFMSEYYSVAASEGVDDHEVMGMLRPLFLFNFFFLEGLLNQLHFPLLFFQVFANQLLRDATWLRQLGVKAIGGSLRENLRVVVL